MTLVAAALLTACGSRSENDDFVRLFNGQNLDGWVNINCAPDTFGVRDGTITVTGAPICEIRTERMYENFILEAEWQHLEPQGNAGIFIWADALPARGQPFLRAIEIQVLDGRNTDDYTSHGDVFAIHGAVLTPDRPHPSGWMRSLPRERRARPAGEWNHYRITADRGTVTLAVNGAEVSGGHDISPRKGYIALESEGAPVLFRNLRIRELPPDPGLGPAHVATAEAGHVSQYNGLTFTGWSVPADQADRWKPHDWRLAYRSADGAPGEPLRSVARFGDIEVIADWRWVETDEAAASVAAPASPGRLLDARAVVAAHPGPHVEPAGRWNRTVQRLVGNRLTMTVNGHVVVDDEPQEGRPEQGVIALLPSGVAVEFANVFVKLLE